MKRKLLILLVFFTGSFTLSTFADNCTQTFTGSGQDDTPTVVTVLPGNITCTGGGTITGITLNNAAGSLSSSYCGNWYNFDLIVDGTTIISGGCKADFDGTVISVPFTSISVQSNDIDAYGDYVTITFDLDIVYTAPACPLPTALSETNITINSADLTWTEAGLATTWDIEYGATPYTFTGTPNITGTTTNPHNLTGLSASTEYTWKVRAYCGVGDESDWSSNSTFTTACDAIASFPYFEGFETAWVGVPAAPQCWSVVDNNGDNDKWSQNTSTSYVHSGSKSAKIYTDYNSTNDDWLITPALDLSGTDDYRLKFWTRAHSTSETDEIQVLLSTTNNDIASFTEVLMASTTIDFTTYAEYTLSLASYSSTVYIAFVRNQSPADGWNLYLDDITVEAIPACPTPFDLVTSDITKSGATLAWTAGYLETAWEYSYGLEGYGPPTVSGTSVMTSPTADISGLNANESYDWYVRANCGPSLSAWVGPKNFKTLCDGVVAFPYEEDFENGGEMPDCWTQVNENGSTTDWDFTAGGHSGRPAGAYDGNFNALLYGTSHGSVTWLVSPALDLSSATTPLLEFWHAQTEWYGDQDELSVYYKTSATGDWTLIPGAEWTENISDWTKAGFFLPEPSAEYYIGFKATSDYGYGVVIDQVKITAVPPIPLSNWAVLLGIFLMSAVLFFRFKR